MKKVGIAELKSHLSAHLKAVRKGQIVTVMDRDQPVARIVPFVDRGGEFLVRKATGSIHDVKLPPPLKPPIDSLSVLLETRRADR